MRRFVLTLFLVGVGLVSFAQKNTKKAEKFLEEGKFEAAKRSILEASSSDEKKEARMWYVYGKIMKESAIAERKKNNNKEFSHFEAAIKGWKQAKNLAAPQSTYYLLSDTEINNLWSSLLNDGVGEYGKQNFRKAADYFRSMQLAKPADTLAYIYQVSTGFEMKDYNLVSEGYYKLMRLGYKNPQMYSNLISIERYTNNDQQKALKICEAAIQAYPKDINFKKQRIDLLSNLGRKKEALVEAESLILLEPQNETLRLFIGMMAQDLGQNQKAESFYRAVLMLNPQNFEANYNLGTLYYTQGQLIMNELNKIQDYDEHKRQEPAFRKRINAQMKKALPYFEKCQSIKKDEREVLFGLRGIYVSLGMEEKVKPIQLKIKELGY